MRYNFISIGWLLKKRDNKCCPWQGKDWKCTVGGNSNSVAIVKNSMAVPQKMKNTQKNYQRI